MSREHFISDNLINIRDRLRQNYEEKTVQSPRTAPETAANNEIHLDLKNPVIQAAPSAGGRSSDREYNEFAGRLQHDLAAVSAELQALEGKQQALNKFYSQLQETADSLQKIKAVDSQEFFREFDRLRIIYFQASGQASCFRSGTTGSSGISKPQKPAAEPRRDLLLPAAVLIAAAMISLTLLIVF